MLTEKMFPTLKRKAPVMSEKSILEDALSLGRDALSTLVEARHEFKAHAKEHVGSVARRLDLVSREEFDAAFAMIAKARDMQEDLAARLLRIESHLNLSPKVKKAAPKMVKTKKANSSFVKTTKKVRAEK